MAYKQKPMSFGNEIPNGINNNTKTNYKKDKSKTTNNELTAKNYDEHDVHAEKTNPTDGRYCAECGVAKEDHDATHSFKVNKSGPPNMKDGKYKHNF